MAQPKKYPFYMYHKNEQYPLIVNNKDEEQALTNKGWSKAYIKKDYPKWVDGRIVNSKEEHDALLDLPQMKVTKGPLKGEVK